MYKKSTNLKNSKIVNDLLSYIYDNIETKIDIEALAKDFGISKFHLHKIFKAHTSEPIYQTIKSVRLQKASNILITNRHSTITEVSNMCGYSTQTSFIRAFKQRFNQTPKYWRNGGFREYTTMLMDEVHHEEQNRIDFSELKQALVKVKPRMAYYRRQKGYNIGYKQIWEKMFAWIYTHGICEYELIGIYHDNPTLTPLHECQYVACVVPKDKEIDLSQNSLPALEIQECLCITFDIQGSFDTLLKLIQWVYHEWLPDSGYEKITIPPYMIFEKIDIFNDHEILKGVYHVPVRAI